MKRLVATAFCMAGLLLTVAFSAASAAPHFSAEELYNVANAYARAGKPGMAVLNYERARLLAPDDKDIEANLKSVRESHRLDGAPHTWFEDLLAVQTPTIAALSGTFGLLLLGASVLAGRVGSQLRGAHWVAAVFGLALIALTVCQGALLWPSLEAGVIIAEKAPVLESPVPMAEPLFVLPEGEIVRVTAEHENFILIKTKAGRLGWIVGASLARIVPN